jgi:3-phosphoshikimate 1-carboxyvinyltransferase
VKAVIRKSEINGTIAAPSSKSAMQRAVAASLLSSGTSYLTNISDCDDSIASMRIAEVLGATITKSENGIYVSGGFNPVDNILDCREAGLSARLFTPLAALHDMEMTITGKGSLLARPFGMIESTLAELGVQVKTRDGFLPVKVKGPIKGGNATVDGSVSSQFLSGLLMALPLAKNDSVLKVNDLKSKPYVDLTIRILNRFGISIENDNYKTFNIKGNQKYNGTDYYVEGDWSGAAFLLVLGALGGDISVTGLDNNSVQADRAIIEGLKRAGAEMEISEGLIRVRKSNLKGFEFNVSECPDLAPPLVALAARCEGTTLLSGTERLRSKESDRGVTLEEEFNKLGVRVVNHKSSLEIAGVKTLRSAYVSSHNDHRIAMALAIAGTTSDGITTIEKAESVNKSYPGFYNDCQTLGANIELVNN